MFFWQNNALTRAERRARLLPFAGLLAFVVLAIVDNYQGVGGVFRWLMAASLIVIAVGILILKHLERRTRELILEGKVHVCPACTYSLAGLDPAGNCPECGVPYTPESLKLRWAKQYQLWDLANVLSKPGPPRCPRCNYSLVGLAASGRCPECGLSYSLELLERDSSATTDG